MKILDKLKGRIIIVLRLFLFFSHLSFFSSKAKSSQNWAGETANNKVAFLLAPSEAFDAPEI
jgi:hypothetical protein